MLKLFFRVEGAGCQCTQAASCPLYRSFPPLPAGGRCATPPRSAHHACTRMWWTRNTRARTHTHAHYPFQVLFDLPDFMIVSAYTLLAVVWAEAFLQVCAVLVFAFYWGFFSIFAFTTVVHTRRFAPRTAYAVRFARSGRKSTSNYAKRVEGR